MKRCSACSGKFRPIPGDGPRPAPVLIVGERPGQTENRWNRVFVGKTGEELNETYLPLAGLHRDEVRVCNTVLCWAEANRTPTDKEIEYCAAHHLPFEIDRTKPELIILMGASACQLVPSIKLEMHHGFPQYGKLFDWEGWIVPMYHPSLGMHESKWMTQILEDWEQLQNRRVDSTRDQTYPSKYLVAKPEMFAGRTFRSLAIDTEDHCGVPFSTQVSPAPGEAYFIPTADKHSLHAMSAACHPDCEFTFHFALHDLDILSQIGLHPSSRNVRDTMQEAYHLGNLPQGLKSLVYRLFGYTMTSWEDVVRPYSIEALLEWLIECSEIARADLSLIDVVRLKTKIRETVKKGPLEQLATRLIVHTDHKSQYDPWERLDDFWAFDGNDWMTSHIEARIGKYPRLGIANAPLPKAVEYACSDADWTGQTAIELARLRTDRRLQIAEEDKDK